MVDFLTYDKDAFGLKFHRPVLCAVTQAHPLKIMNTAAVDLAWSQLVVPGHSCKLVHALVGLIHARQTAVAFIHL